ncbi:MAG: hypothetical protein ISR64_06680 [Deltaproteobacteria bacterium]|nr:hypothetical protein [Deltaproteobacteria bacterium]
MLDRRRFLTVLAGGLLVGRPLVVLGGTLPARSAGGRLVPGQVVKVRWPSFFDYRAGRVVHRLDGHVVSRVPLPAPTGRLLGSVDVLAVPVDGRFRAGRHQFRIEWHGRSLVLGGFHIQSFDFGC